MESASHGIASSIVLFSFSRWQIAANECGDRRVRLGAQSKDRAERLHTITCRPERHSRLRNAVLARREIAAALAQALERARLRAAAAHD